MGRKGIVKKASATYLSDETITSVLFQTPLDLSNVSNLPKLESK
jgi:hypothetical protein